MPQFVASAPSKLILGGEHAVVYGGKALVLPLDNRKSCTVSIEPCEEGKGEIVVEDSVGIGRVGHDGKVSDRDGSFSSKAAVISHFLKTEGVSFPNQRLLIQFSQNVIPKGTGGSASAFAALSLALYAAFSVAATKEKLFEAVQAGEEIAHGGKASGVDARAVLSETPIEFYKDFSARNSVFHFHNLNVQLPAATALVIISTALPGALPEPTSTLVKRFADRHGILHAPHELPPVLRENLVAPYNHVIGHLKNELRSDGDPARIGLLLEENQRLLRDSDVSSERIEQALALCKKHGAYGGKLTGAGGNGGACFALVPESKLDEILAALNTAGFECVLARQAKNGPEVKRL